MANEPARSKPVSLDLTIGYSFPQKSRLKPLNLPNTHRLGGLAVSVNVWKNLFRYDDTTKSFDLGASVGYLPFVQKKLTLYAFRLGVKHSMYFVKKSGFEQAVMIGIANPLNRSPEPLKKANFSVSGHFGYFLPTQGSLTVGARWNWNFIWLRSFEKQVVSTSVFDLGIRSAL
ncbi:hypothetical protein ACO2Q8_01335 [Larkinella sp. VNQ87]|uniref:hypothetical protein n=1 Tax=Larkinella sp. VNQ87 TaxID=3400921 RepID=UPI003C0AF1C6